MYQQNDGNNNGSAKKPPLDVSQSLDERLSTFKEKLRFQLEAILTKSIDDYSREHFGEQLPVEDFMRLMDIITVSLTGVVLKNITLGATFYNNPNIGSNFINALMKDYVNAISNFDDLRNQLTEQLTKSITVHSVH